MKFITGSWWRPVGGDGGGFGGASPTVALVSRVHQTRRRSVEQRRDADLYPLSRLGVVWSSEPKSILVENGLFSTILDRSTIRSDSTGSTHWDHRERCRIVSARSVDGRRLQSVDASRDRRRLGAKSRSKGRSGSGRSQGRPG